MDNTQPVLRFDDEVDAAAQLVPHYGYDEAERIIDEAVRTHRPVESLVPKAA
jgi:aspartate ammonia-lyase